MEDIIEGEVVELTVVEKQTDGVMTKAGALLAHVETLGPIKTDAQDDEQKTMQASIKAELKAWEADRKSLTDPLYRLQIDIKARYDSAAEPAVKALGILNAHITLRFTEKREAARKEQMRQDKLAAKRLETATRKAEEKGEEAPEPMIPMPVVSAPAKTTVTSQGKVTVSEYWDCKFAEDATAAVKAAVAAGRLDLLLPNEKAARGLVRAGVREIPGYTVFQALKV